MPHETSRPLLEVKGLSSGYGNVPVLREVNLAMRPAEIVALVGSNGAGKSTLLKAISGLLPTTTGSITWDGVEIAGYKPGEIVSLGLLHVAEGRRLFREQSVEHNLDLGFYGAGLGRHAERRRLEEVLTMFPILADKRKALAGALSGGQQQMLAIAQAVMRAPRLLMLDEPSLGLAPIVVDQVFDFLVRLRDSGCAVLLVEQLVERAMEIAGHAFVLQEGRIVGSGPAADLMKSAIVTRAYMAGQA
jgi:branched-chain amino acid transport system ATP-binding protein